jgi:hypothetical protein
MTQIFKHTTLKLDDLTYTKPEKLGNHYYSQIYHGDNKPVYIQTPLLGCGIPGSNLNSKNSLLQLKIDGDDFGIYDFFLKLDDHNVDQTFSMSKEWFGKELPVNVIDDMYRRGTKPFEKGSNPSLDFKIPFTKDKCECICFNKEKQSVEIADIAEDSELVCIVHIKGLKFLKKEYYCDCYITQIKVNEVRVNKSFFDECLIEDEVVKDSKEDEKEDEKNDSELEKEKEEGLEKVEKERLEKERLEKEEKEKKDKEEKQSELTLKEKEHEILSQTLNNLADEIQTLRKELES